MAKRALITGITGQDGSYLAELLLKKGYQVFGIVQRSATDPFDNIRHILDDVRICYGDLSDSSSLIRAMQLAQPDEVYNLGAQSFVKSSWDVPEMTGDITGVGVTRMLEAVRTVKKDARFYQASSSEMFGQVAETPQKETTPFHPRSPYGVAKVYGHWITVNYRESYDMFAASGILFNHECVTEHTPLVIKLENYVDVVTIQEIVPLRRKGTSIQIFEMPGLKVWDGTNWTDVKAITATHRLRENPDHNLLSIQARGGTVAVTAHHHMITSDGEEVSAKDVKASDKMLMADTWPSSPEWTSLTEEMAEFLGLIVADGYISENGRKIKFTNNDSRLLKRVAELWSRLFLGTTCSWTTPSGWNKEKDVQQLSLNGGCAAIAWLRAQLYTKEGFKKVPRLVLNATLEVQEAFIKGYYAGDGLKKGKGQSIKTNSPVLAQGMLWLYANQDRKCSVYEEQRDSHVYYQINIGTEDRMIGEKGQHLRKAANEVRLVAPDPRPSEWVFDIETISGVFMAGVGRLVVHNSPRRGYEFVTQKIASAAAYIKAGLAKELLLGNLDAKRDWGFAGDYVEAMWLMLQQEQPDDYVIGTGETHSVREFVELAFKHVGLDWRQYVKQDERYMRPAEVDLLLADPSKAKAKLDWKPKVKFPELVTMMVDAALKRIADHKAGVVPKLPVA